MVFGGDEKFDWSVFVLLTSVISVIIIVVAVLFSAVFHSTCAKEPPKEE